MVEQVSILQLAERLATSDSVFIAGSSGEPQELTRLLAHDLRIAPQARFVTSFVPGINPNNLAPAGSLRKMRVFFHSAEHDKSRREGSIEFCPFAYSTIQRYLVDPHTPIDTLVVQVSKPDADGRCSLGPAAEFLPSLLQRNVQVFAIINEHVASLRGAESVPMERFSCYACSDAPLAQYNAGTSNEVSDRIAAHLCGIIPSGAALQIGLGKVPSQLLRALSIRRDLSLHSGLLSDSVLALIESGALRNESALTTTVALGSRAFYERLVDLREMRIRGVEYTHNPVVLAKLKRFFAINSAIEVDLLGQVNAEAVGGRWVSGPGGLPDFAHAARRSVDGLSIIALNSTDASGRQSRIVTALDTRTPVTVPQHDVDAVVTEYGVAILRGCDVAERAHRLAGVAHPHYREMLLSHAPS